MTPILFCFYDIYDSLLNFIIVVHCWDMGWVGGGRERLERQCMEHIGGENMIVFGSVYAEKDLPTGQMDCFRFVHPTKQTLIDMVGGVLTLFGSSVFISLFEPCWFNIL